MIDPENIPTTSIVSLLLPQLIFVDDYHEFHHLENIFQELGLQVLVEEIGFVDTQYVGVIHTNTEEERATVQQLIDYYKEEV